MRETLQSYKKQYGKIFMLNNVAAVMNEAVPGTLTSKSLGRCLLLLHELIGSSDDRNGTCVSCHMRVQSKSHQEECSRHISLNRTTMSPYQEYRFDSRVAESG